MPPQYGLAFSRTYTWAICKKRLYYYSRFCALRHFSLVSLFSSDILKISSPFFSEKFLYPASLFTCHFSYLFSRKRTQFFTREKKVNAYIMPWSTACTLKNTEYRDIYVWIRVKKSRKNDRTFFILRSDNIIKNFRPLLFVKISNKNDNDSAKKSSCCSNRAVLEINNRKESKVQEVLFPSAERERISY